MVISDSVSYNSASGTITLLQPDRYEFDWWVDRQSSASSNGVGFALVSSQGDVLVGKIKPSVISKNFTPQQTQKEIEEPLIRL